LAGLSRIRVVEGASMGCHVLSGIPLILLILSKDFHGQPHRTKKARLPLDTKLIVVYIWNSSMDTTSEWTGAPDKTREPIRARERASSANRKFLPGTPRICHPQIALFPRCFCAVSKGGVYYPLLPNYLRSPTPKRRNSWLATFHASRFTHQPSVTAEIDRFWTVSGPFLNSLSITHWPPTTCKAVSQNRSNSWLTLQPEKWHRRPVDVLPGRRTKPKASRKTWGEDR